MKHCSDTRQLITVGARESPLSKKQVEEVLRDLLLHHPTVEFVPLYTKTYGDLDRTTSLRVLGKTNFFTREIDEMQLQGKCRISIHSAKDLPDPLRKGLVCVALTQGIDPSDSLVLKEGACFEELPKGARIGTSSLRREEMLKKLRDDWIFIDIRGTIEERLTQLRQGLVDGVVIAEAALIRLELTALNRIRLSGETTPLQGRLAVIAREGDQEMRELFKCFQYSK